MAHAAAAADERVTLGTAGGGAFSHALTLPLVSAGGLFGAAVLLWNGGGVDPVEVQLVEGLVDLAAVALDRAHRTRRLQETLDELRESREILARREKLEALGEMAAVVAHEVKNPLASISGALQVLGQRMPSDSTEGRIVEMVVLRLRDLSAMVDELLLFARPRSPALVRLPVARLLEGVAGLFSANPKWAGIALRVVVEPPDAEIVADGDQLQGVLLNLLLNAAQACDGQGDVWLTATTTGDRVWIRVRDRGPGVPEPMRERIFDPFVTTKTRGSGLGLAVARQVVEGHSGSIRLESPPDGGALFVIELPNGCSRSVAARVEAPAKGY
jgi:signal transduction histidine kinase